MTRRIETLFLPGPAGRLECLLEEPEGGPPNGVALVCHPHPKGGGTMHNKVVYRMARALRTAGRVVFRFNYRGVNLSEGTYDEGRGEKEDARVALRELTGRYPGLPVTLSGFSFGSRIALRLAVEESAPRNVIAAGFPTRLPDYGYVYDVAIPKHFIHSTNDEYGPRDQFLEFYRTLPEPKELVWIEAGDHFFKDALDHFESAMLTLARNS